MKTLAQNALDAAVRRVVATKYDEWQEGQAVRTLSGWALTVLPVDVRFVIH